MSQEKRKYPRFDTSLDVVFYDQKRTKGKLVNISKKGCLMVMDGAKLRAIDSMITFRVFFDGIPSLRENTIPQISPKDFSASAGDSMDEADYYPEAVKVVAKVARHVAYNKSPAMGIELLELDGNDLIKWNTFLTKLNREQLVLPYVGTDKKLPFLKHSSEVPVYPIRFKSLNHAIQYFPRDPKQTLFVPGPPRDAGQKIKFSMIHPDNGSTLQFDAIVESSGPYSKNKNIYGIYVRYEKFTPELKNQINQFLNELHY
jgi:hypothetical protein